MKEAKQNDDALQARARQRIEQNRLPREKPVRIWGGRGTGVACSLCDTPILDSEPEMELEYDAPAAIPTVRFHLRCQSLWDVARRSQTPSQWIPVTAEMPPLHTVVEARLSLGGTRAVILNIMRVCDGETGPVVWLNATTNGQLPEAWQPVEWRGLQAANGATGPAGIPAASVHRRA